MQVYNYYPSPVQQCMTPPRQQMGQGFFVASPQPMQMSPHPQQWAGVAPPGYMASPQHMGARIPAQGVAASPNVKVPEAHFKYEIGDRFEVSSRHPRGRYTIVKCLGAGVYGKVFDCRDEENPNVNVAIKAVRSEPAYRDAARREIRALKRIGVHEVCARMLRDFDYKGHICIVQEKIGGGTIFERLKATGGFSLHATQCMTKQLLAGLEHIHKNGMIHTDIKTDNLMINGHDASGAPLVKIVDLGSAIFRSDPHPDMIGTKEYRAPEAVLQAGYSTPADVWALGCSVFEIFTGKKLFDFEHEITQLHMIEGVLGAKIPMELIRKGYFRRNKFNQHLIQDTRMELAFPQSSELSKITGAVALTTDVKHPELANLLRWMLHLDPAQRPTATALPGHSFFKQDLEEKQLPQKELTMIQGHVNAILESSGSEDLSICSTIDHAAAKEWEDSQKDDGSNSASMSNNSPGSTVEVQMIWAPPPPPRANVDEALC
mmetsp:Transcript_199/g.436  ORF Transcript_199/g.436 Transcript_199/m.436 type:complete len:489 (+) Transcript_199:212-1678(+)|eukprot:CAMPEP_0181299328 /NCGR_PEP_ID=MMETSP1101-20121128/6285_1 /TAXON_ID=46948 /ORGANISM="Rhodomonas abbreviata, Strain Caron Lab Isolate" /LENGTH=488 /DNA_ID=CAMNT_0023404465 /DNA_START=189 /DNA_END=1655 /DNA_ORIENTATION=+